MLPLQMVPVLILFSLPAAFVFIQFENYSRWIDLADKQREKSKIEQLFDGKCANSVPKNTEMKISIGYLSDILVEAGSTKIIPKGI